MSDVNMLKSRFENSPSSSGGLQRVKPSPPPKPVGKISRLGASLQKNIGENGALRGTESNLKCQKLPSKSFSADNASDAAASPGFAALANVLRTSPTFTRKAPPPPPTKPHPSPKPSPTSSPRNSPPIPLKWGEKSKSEEVDSSLTLATKPSKRPHSTTAVNIPSDLSEPVSLPRSSPVLNDSPLGSPASRRKLRRMSGLSKSYEDALDSPIAMDSPPTIRTSKAQSRSPDDALKSSGKRSSLVSDRKARASSLPRTARFSASPPPVEEEREKSLSPPVAKQRAVSSIHVRPTSPKPIPPPRPKSSAKPAVAPKPANLPKPIPPPKPPSLSDLRKLPGFNQPKRKGSSSREGTPESQATTKDSSRETTPDTIAQMLDFGPPAVVVRTESGTTTFRSNVSSSSDERAIKPRSSSRERGTTADSPGRDERVKPRTGEMVKPDSPGRDEGVKSPDTPSGNKEPGTLSGVQDRTSRNADSGFISEAPEDLVLGREEGSVVEDKASTRDSGAWDEARLEKSRLKRQKIAQELLDTEKTYVDRLKMIAVDFHGAVVKFNASNKHVIPESDVQQIFLNLQQIHTLNENILQELKTRMDTWSEHEGLGDVICRLAPFLKLYSTYTAGFEDAMKLLTEWTSRNKKFDELVREFGRELSTGLGVAHYMLEPVQRIPRYKLLLTDYLKYLPKDSHDRPNTEKALAIISEAASQSNDRIKELEITNEILSIQRSVQDYEGTLLSPSRIFLKKGTLQKFSRKTLTPRMFFLFSDILLHTYSSGAEVYKFRNEMPIFGMKVEEPKVSLVPHSFEVHSTTRSLILAASSEDEKVEWMDALITAIEDDMKKRSSLRRDSTKDGEEDTGSGVFGAKAPIMVPDKSVTMCQVCSAQFTFTFRRHHCRACGKVVCGTCSQWKVFLTYMQKVERVCEDCSTKAEPSGVAPPSPKALGRKAEGVLNLKAFGEDARIAGYVLGQEGKKSTRLWYQLKKDNVLYKFKAHEDIKAIRSMPLLGYMVLADKGSCTITLNHPSGKKQFSDTFKVEVDTPEEFDQWVSALQQAVKLDLTSSLSPADIEDRKERSKSLRAMSSIMPDSGELSPLSSLEQSI